MLPRRFLTRPAAIRLLAGLSRSNLTGQIRSLSGLPNQRPSSTGHVGSLLSVDRVSSLLKHDVSIDAGVIALKSIMYQLRGGRISLADHAVLDVFCKAVGAVGGCAHSDVLFDAMTFVVSTDNKLNPSLSREQLNALMDTFTAVALAQTDPKLALAVLHILVTQRLTVSAGTAAEFVAAYERYLEISKENSRRFKLQTSPDSAPEPIVVPSTVVEFSEAQWASALDAVISHVNPPVNSRESYAFMAALAGCGKVKETFMQFDVYRELLKAEGVTSVLPEAFGPLAHVCKVACHPNRAMKVLKWMERESIAPTIQTVEDVVVTLCRANDVHNAAALLDNLLDPDGVASGRIASDAVIVEMMEALARNGETPQIIQLFEAAKLVNRLEDVDFCEDTGAINLSGFSPAVTATLLPYVLESMIDDIKDGDSPVPPVVRLYFSESNKLAAKAILQDKMVEFSKQKKYFVIKSDQFQRLLAPKTERNQSLLQASYLSTSDDDEEVERKANVQHRQIQDLTLDLPPRRSRSRETPSLPSQSPRQRTANNKSAPVKRLSFYGDEVKESTTPAKPASQPQPAPKSPSFWTFYCKDAKGNTTSVPRRVVRPDPDSAFVEAVDSTRRRRW